MEFTVDENLSWNNHVENVGSAMSTGIYALWQLSKIFDLATLKTIYHSLILSHLSYCIGPMYLWRYIKTKFRQHSYWAKKAIRVILSLKNSEIVKHLCTQINILTFYSLYILKSIKYARKHCSNDNFEVSSFYNMYLWLIDFRPAKSRVLFKKDIFHIGKEFHNSYESILKVSKITIGTNVY